eukprot:3173206-Pleurochrysis_carterae.AAC.8
MTGHGRRRGNGCGGNFSIRNGSENSGNACGAENVAEMANHFVAVGKAHQLLKKFSVLRRFGRLLVIAVFVAFQQAIRPVHKQVFNAHSDNRRNYVVGKGSTYVAGS